MLEMCIVILKSSYSLHDQKYYISLDGQNCVENKITYCLYAFAFSPLSRINSLDYDFFPHSEYLKNQISLCGQCQEKYTYNQEENKCQPQQYNNECYYSYLAKKTSVQEVCLFGPKLNTPEDPVSFVTQSLCLNNNCHICLADQINIKPSYICLECNNGYYAEKLSGFCLPCPPKLNCQICYQQNKISKDNWKNQLRAFYRATLDDNQQSHSFIIDLRCLNHIEYGLSQTKEDYEIVCKFCLDGYELHNGKCIEPCPYSCLKCKIIDDMNICIECPLIQGKRSLRIQDNQCIQCPGSCVFCRSRKQEEIQQINPLFNNSGFSYFSNQCLLKDKGHYDIDLKMYVDCPSLACMKEIQIILNLHCSRDQYDQLIQSLQTQEETRRFKQSNIFIDDLFSESSLLEFEQPQFYNKILFSNCIRWRMRSQSNQLSQELQVLNHKLAQQKIIKALNNNSVKISFLPQMFNWNLMEMEIQLKTINIVNYTIFQYDTIISIVNFKKVIIQGIILQPLPVKNLKQFLFKSVFEQEIELLNIRYKSNLIQDQSQILIWNSTIVYINNFQTNDLSLTTMLAFILVEEIQSFQNITIENLNMKNCSFNALNVFQLNTKSTDKLYLLKSNLNTIRFQFSQLLQLPFYYTTTIYFFFPIYQAKKFPIYNIIFSINSSSGFLQINDFVINASQI